MTDTANVQARPWIRRPPPGGWPAGWQLQRRGARARLLSCRVALGVSRPWPGALGRAVRSFVYARCLDACGRNVVFGRNVVVRHPHRIRIGDDVLIDDNCLLDAGGEAGAGIAIGAGSSLGRNTVLECLGGVIELGTASNLGFNCELRSARRVVVGADALFGARCSVLDCGPDDGRTVRSGGDRRPAAPGVGIGAGVWMGAGARIMGGVSIGAGAMIAAGAVVFHDVPERGVALGSPARVVGTREARG